MNDLTDKDMDPDTWMLYQVRKRSPKDYGKLQAHVRELPNPIADLDAKIKKMKAELKVLSEERNALAAACKHIAWNDEGCYDYIHESCIQCGKMETY